MCWVDWGWSWLGFTSMLCYASETMLFISHGAKFFDYFHKLGTIVFKRPVSVTCFANLVFVGYNFSVLPRSANSFGACDRCWFFCLQWQLCYRLMHCYSVGLRLERCYWNDSGEVVTCGFLFDYLRLFKNLYQLRCFFHSLSISHEIGKVFQ